MQLRTLLFVLFIMHCTHHATILLRWYWNKSSDEVTDVEFYMVKDKPGELNITNDEKFEVSHTLLPKVDENIRTELLGKACVDKINLSTDIVDNNKDVLLSLVKIQKQVNHIHRDTKRIVAENGDTVLQCQHNLENLEKMNKTMHSILSGIESMLAKIEQKMKWINDYIDNENGRLDRLYETSQHFAYLFAAMIFAAFLQAPFVMRASIIGIVPLNIVAFFKYGSCLGFTSTTTLIFLITGVHFLIMNRNRLFIQHQSKVGLILNTTKIRICDYGTTTNTRVKQIIEGLGQKLNYCKELIIRNVQAVAIWIRQQNRMNSTQRNDSDARKVLLSDLQLEEAHNNDKKDGFDTELSSDELQENATVDSLTPSFDKKDLPNDNKKIYTFSDGTTTKLISIPGIDFPDLPLNIEVPEKLPSEAMRSQTKLTDEPQKAHNGKEIESPSTKNEPWKCVLRKTFTTVPEIPVAKNNMVNLIDKVPKAEETPDNEPKMSTKSSSGKKVHSFDRLVPTLQKHNSEHTRKDGATQETLDIKLTTSSSDQKELCSKIALKEASDKVGTAQEKNDTDSDALIKSITVQRVRCSNPSTKETRENLATDSLSMTSNGSKSINKVGITQEKYDIEQTMSPESSTAEQDKSSISQREITDFVSRMRTDKVENTHQVEMTEERSDIVPKKVETEGETESSAVKKVPGSDLPHEESPKLKVNEIAEKYLSTLQDDTNPVAVTHEKTVTDLTDRPQPIPNRPVNRATPNLNSTNQAAQSTAAPLDRNRNANHSVSPTLPNMSPALPQVRQSQRADLQSSVGNNNTEIPNQTEARGNTTINIMNVTCPNNLVDESFSGLVNMLNLPSSTNSSVSIREELYCGAMTQNGTACRNKPSYGGPRCWRHDATPSNTSNCSSRSIGYVNDDINYSFYTMPPFSPVRSSSSLSVSRSGCSGDCGAKTQKGAPCRNKPSYGGSKCWRH